MFIVNLAKKFNKRHNTKMWLKTLLGASRFNVLLSLFFEATGVKKKEQKYISKNKNLKNIYSGKRCFILGNGPSVKKKDISKLKDEIVFTVNQFSNTEQFQIIKPKFHLWADERFFSLKENNEGDMEILKDMLKASDKNSSTIVFYKIEANELIRKFKLDKKLRVYYYSDKLVFDETYKKAVDISSQIPWYPTVVQYAIFFAIYMGIKEIYLLGCECSGILNFIKEKDSQSSITEYAYSYNVNNKEQKNFQEAMEKRTSKAEFEGHFKVFQYYEWIKKYCDERKVKLYNCTPGGLLDSIPRIDFEKIVR